MQTRVVSEGQSPDLHFELEVHLFPLKLSKHQQSHLGGKHRPFLLVDGSLRDQ